MIPGFRILLILCFSLFWGGLTFYTGFVVRISHDVLGDPMDGARRVPNGSQNGSNWTPKQVTKGSQKGKLRM